MTRFRFALLSVSLLATALTTRGAPTHEALPPWNENGRIGHQQLIEKAKTGRIDLYFLGDSITRRWGATDYPDFLANWQATFHGWNAGNFGWGGDTTHHMLWRIQNGQFDGLSPKVIVLLSGTNNIGKTPKPESAADVVQGVEAILATLRTKSPTSVVVLMAIFPRNDGETSNAAIAEANAGLAKLADGKTVRFLNINNQLADANGQLLDGVSVDKLHLSRKGYEIWGRALTPVLTELLGPRAEVDLAPPPTGDPAAAAKRDPVS